MDKRLNDVIKLMQFSHIVSCAILIFLVIVALIFNYKEIVYEYESAEFVRRITKISIGFIVGIIGAHLIPFIFFWRKMKKKKSGKRIKMFLRGSFWQWSLLLFLGLCLLIIFFMYTHAFVMGFFVTLFIILLAKRPTHYRLLDKTQLTSS